MRDCINVIKSKHYLVAVVFLLGLAGYLFSMRAIWNTDKQDVYERVELNASTRADALYRDIETAVQSTNIPKYILEKGYSLDGEQFAALASEIIEYNPCIDNLQLAPNGKVTQIYPLEGNEAGLIDLLADEKRGPIAAYGRDSRQVTIQGPFHLKQGGQGLAIRNPVYIKAADGSEKFWGFTIAIIKVSAVFQRTIENLTAFGYDFALYKTDPLQNNYQYVAGSTDCLENPVSINFAAGGADWCLEVTPAGGWHIMRDIEVYIILGLIMFLLIIVLVYVIVVLDKERKILQMLSRHDELTGLLNKRVFTKQIQKMDCLGTLGGIFYVDVNCFKSVNDTYGHSVGDDVLKEVAQRLCRVTKNQAFRIGGDEFVILIKNRLAAADYKRIAATIAQAFKQPIVSGNLRLPVMVSVSIGYAMTPDDAPNMQSLYEIADRRMYGQKKNSKK